MIDIVSRGLVPNPPYMGRFKGKCDYCRATVRFGREDAEKVWPSEVCGGEVSDEEAHLGKCPVCRTGYITAFAPSSRRPLRLLQRLVRAIC